MAKKTKRRKRQIPAPIDLDVKPRAYQPSAAELSEEIDMPGLSELQLKKLLRQPFNLHD